MKTVAGVLLAISALLPSHLWATLDFEPNDTMAAANSTLVLGLGGSVNDVLLGSGDVVHFQRNQGDRIDLPTIDADARAGDDQAFRWRGADGFPDNARELRFQGGILQADVNGNRMADFELRIIGPLLEGDIIP